MTQDVFISYSSKDAEPAQAVCKALEQAGLGCWMAPRDIQGGMSWSDAIMQALESCRVVMLLLSSASNVSVQVHNEINEATNLKRPIVPVRIEDIPLSRHMAYYLGRLHWISALMAPFENHLAAVLEAVQSSLKAGEQVFMPPTSVAEAPRHNLPRQMSSFIGREKESREIEALLATSPLVTLTGSGGIGKTRLALQVAADVLDHYREGVWLVELAALSESSLLPQTVASALGLREEPGCPVLQTLLVYLKDRHLLLVLDNCEHLIGACALLADTLLKACSQLTILATSREGSNIGGERIYRAPALSLPEAGQTSTLESLVHCEAVRLFVERATSVQSSFVVTTQNAAALAQVCVRLDGIPLAIELAAARARSLSVENINSRLDQRFRLLTGGSRTALPRQQTLQALIDWSYDLLNDQEKALLCRLAVFAGGWSLEAAEKVCCGEGIEEWDVVDLLTSLVDKSLVLMEEQDGLVRYRLLETVREYGAEKLKARGEDMQRRTVHRDWCLALAEEAEPLLRGPEQALWLERLEREHDNLRAALTWSRSLGETGEAGLRLCGALQGFWRTRGHLGEGRAWCEAALVQAGAAGRTALWAKALNGAGSLAYLQGDYATAKTYHERSLAIKQAIGDRQGIANSLNNLGNIANNQGDYATARSCHERSLTMKQEIGDRQGIAAALNNLGIVADSQGDGAAARTYHEQSLAISREIGDPNGIAIALHNLGNIANDQGDYPAAKASYEECLTIFREIGDTQAIASSLHNLGNLARMQDDYASAQVYHAQSLSIKQKIGDRHGIAVSLDNLGLVGDAQGDYLSAKAYYAQSLAISREIGNRQGIANTLNNLGNVSSSQGDYPVARAYYEECLALCREIGERQGIAYALEAFAALIAAEATAVTVPMETAGVSEDTYVGVRRAARLWAAARALREQIGAPLSPKEQAELDQKMMVARARLDEADWTAEWEEGNAMSMEQAVDYSLASVRP